MAKDKKNGTDFFFSAPGFYIQILNDCVNPRAQNWHTILFNHKSPAMKSELVKTASCIVWKINLIVILLPGCRKSWTGYNLWLLDRVPSGFPESNSMIFRDYFAIYSMIDQGKSMRLILISILAHFSNSMIFSGLENDFSIFRGFHDFPGHQGPCLNKTIWSLR